jgi:hypothetical protein
MARSIRTLVAAVALSGALVGAVPTAGAAAGLTDAVVSFQGSATTSPGVALSPANQAWRFSFFYVTTTGLVNGEPVFGAYSSCTATGASSIPETILYGAGTGEWTCSWGALAGFGGTLTYVHTGQVGAVAVSGDVTGALYCEFVGHQTPPATVVDFDVVCVGGVTNSV